MALRMSRGSGNVATIEASPARADHETIWYRNTMARIAWRGQLIRGMRKSLPSTIASRLRDEDERTKAVSVASFDFAFCSFRERM